MIAASPKTAILVVGLPYTGKTTLINSLMKPYPGNKIIADQIYLQEVSPGKVSLQHWLDYCTVLVERIKSKIIRSTEAFSFVELGIMPRTHRSQLAEWLQNDGHRVIPLWLKCENVEKIVKRRNERGGKTDNDGEHIDISLGDLYERIKNSFEEPLDDEGFVQIDTAGGLETCIGVVTELLD